MENPQDKRGTKKKREENLTDLRQMDLWSSGASVPSAPAASAPTASAPEAPVAIKTSPQATEKKAVVDQPQVVSQVVMSAPTAAPANAAKTETTPTANRPARLPTAAPATTRVTHASADALPPLTRRQHDILDYLRERAARGQRPPSLTEICRDLGLISRGSLHKQIVALVAAGLVEPMNGKQRGVRLLSAANDSGEVPLLGAIAAGKPLEALTRDESIVLPTWMRAGNECYALRVKGDSMRDVGILDGDVVVIEPRQTARNGETVVALIDGTEATLKRIEQRPGTVVLHAENPAFAPQRYEAERVRIQGVVVAQLRRYRL